MRGPWPKGVGFYGLLGAVMVVAGSFLPWLSSGGRTVSAWGIPLRALLPSHADSTGLVIGPLLLVPVLVLVPYLIRRPLPFVFRAVLAAVATNLAGLVLVLGVRADPTIWPNVGLLLVLIGGVLIVVGPVGAKQPDLR